jgi:hypothetical protein
MCPTRQPKTAKSVTTTARPATRAATPKAATTDEPEPGSEEATSDEAYAPVVLPGTRSPLDPSRALKVGGHGQPREHVRQVQRDRLIDGFVQVVTEQGYDAAGIKSICRRAGVAFNTFY